MSSNVQDSQYGRLSMPVPQLDPALVSMQDNLAKLQSFLVTHTKEMVSLQRQFQPPPSEPVPVHFPERSRNIVTSPVELKDLGRSVPRSSSSRMPLLATDPHSSFESFDRSRTEFGERQSSSGLSLNTHFQSPVDAPPIAQPPHLDSHVKEIQRFLSVHMRNIQLLHDSLAQPRSASRSPYGSPRPTPGGNHGARGPAQSATPPPPPNAEAATEQMKALSHQFSIIVVFSTFTAGLILAWLQLMSSVLPAPDWDVDRKEALHYYLGFIFGFTGLVLTIGIAIVAGADTAACTSGKPWKPIRAVHGRFRAVVFAQFLSALIFGGSIGMLLFPFHSGSSLVLLPIVILSIAIVVAASDLADMSGEVRSMKHDMKQWFCGLFKRKPA